MRGPAVLALKLLIATALIAWLLYAGTLDLGALRLFLVRPELLAANLGVLAFLVLLGALRWRFLLQLAEVHLSLGRALQLQLAGLFFNIVIPGGVGGDVFKAVYVARDADPTHRPAVYLIGFVDRLLGVASLVVVALCVTILRGRAMWSDPTLRQVGIGVLVLAAVSLLVPLLVVIVLRRSTATITRTGTIGKLFTAARLVASQPLALAAALGLAVLLHVCGMLLFFTLTAALTSDAPFASVATVYPLGMLTLLMPISYAGIGVGHFAFERLFTLVGIPGGASVFNLYLIGQTVPCLLGVFPYLGLRRAAPLPTAAEARSQQAVGYDVPS